MGKTIFDRFAEAIADIRADHANLEARVERMFRKGKVTDVDAKNQLYRQEIGLDDAGNPVKSPWVPYAQFAGARTIHTPVTVGQQMLMISPDGDHEQAHGVPLTFSTAVPSPSQDPNTHVDALGKTKTTITDGTWLQEVEGASISLTKGKVVITTGGSTYEMTDGKIVETSTKIALVGSVALGSEDADRELSLRGTIDSRGDAEVSNLATKVTGI